MYKGFLYVAPLGVRGCGSDSQLPGAVYVCLRALLAAYLARQQKQNLFSHFFKCHLLKLENKLTLKAVVERLLKLEDR